jgi:hypothetical protein
LKNSGDKDHPCLTQLVQGIYSVSPVGSAIVEDAPVEISSVNSTRLGGNPNWVNRPRNTGCAMHPKVFEMPIWVEISDFFFRHPPAIISLTSIEGSVQPTNP